VGGECKSDRQFENRNDQVCSGHFAPTVVTPLAEWARSRSALEDQGYEPKATIALRLLTRSPRWRAGERVAGTSSTVLFSLRSCRRVCRRVGSRRAEARRNRSLRCLRGTILRAPHLPE